MIAFVGPTRGFICQEKHRNKLKQVKSLMFVLQGSNPKITHPGKVIASKREQLTKFRTFNILMTIELTVHKQHDQYRINTSI